MIYELSELRAWYHYQVHPVKALTLLTCRQPFAITGNEEYANEILHVV